MNRISQRKRSLKDDIKSIRHENSVAKTSNGLSVPSAAKEPLVVWADSVQRINVSQDDDIYYCSGNFCSWQCSKAFNMRETSPAGKGNRNMYISILAYKTWIKILKDTPEIYDSVKSFCFYKIDPARPRFELQDFGGSLTIEEYREGFCGVLPPLSSIAETSPLITLRSMAVVPFIDTDGVKATTTVKKTEQEVTFKGIRRLETNRVQEFNNSFCERLKKARDDPTLMKRKKAPDDSNTLLSSMGIKIKKRSS